MKDKIIIDGAEYILASSVKSPKAKDLKGKPYSIVRAYSAGVFAGYVDSEKVEGGIKIVKLLNARRLWYWDGAASLSQLSVDGVSKPQNCKFPCEVEEVELINVIEILPVTEKAKESIAKVKVWAM
jgi:hypothetical protein